MGFGTWTYPEVLHERTGRRPRRRTALAPSVTQTSKLKTVHKHGAEGPGDEPMRKPSSVVTP